MGRFLEGAFCGVLMSALGWAAISHGITVGVEFVRGLF